MKYKNENERKAARKLQNREAKRRSRANIKLRKQSLIPTFTKSLKETYKTNLYALCSKYPFNFSVTVTNMNLVTINEHNRALDVFIKKMISEGHLTNYIVTTEENGGNYHSHLVIYSAKVTLIVKEAVKRYWGNGYSKVVPISTELHRLNAITYCFKQIDVTSNEDLKQKLVDSWLISLPQTFEDVKEAATRLISDYKKANGLTNVIPKNKPKDNNYEF